LLLQNTRSDLQLRHISHLRIRFGCNLWPRIAEVFGVAPGPVQTIRLTEFIAGNVPLWAEMLGRHALEPIPAGRLVILNRRLRDRGAALRHDLQDPASGRPTALERCSRSSVAGRVRGG